MILALIIDVIVTLRGLRKRRIVTLSMVNNALSSLHKMFGTGYGGGRGGGGGGGGGGRGGLGGAGGLEKGGGAKEKATKRNIAEKD